MAILRTVALTTLALAASTLAQQTRQSASENPNVTGTGTNSIAVPTGPVITVTLPGNADSLAIVGSLIGTASSLTTVAITCPDGTPTDDCPLNPAVTITAGANTLHFEESLSSVTAVQNCQFTSGVGGVCTLSNIGAVSDVVEETSTFPSSELGVITTTTSELTIAASDLSVASIVITAGDTAGLTGAASGTGSGGSTASTTATTTSSAGSQSRSSSSSSSGSPTSTSASNNAQGLVPGVLGAGLIGLLAVAL